MLPLLLESGCWRASANTKDAYCRVAAPLHMASVDRDRQGLCVVSDDERAFGPRINDIPGILLGRIQSSLVNSILLREVAARVEPPYAFSTPSTVQIWTGMACPHAAMGWV